MTIHQKIKKALQDFGITVTEDFFGGDNEEYITFNLATDKAVMYADDDPEHDVASVQIHWFLPVEKNYLAGKKEIRRSLHENGFTYPEVTVIVEPDNKTRHIVFVCNVENDEELEE